MQPTFTPTQRSEPTCEITSLAERRCRVTGRAGPGRQPSTGVYWYEWSRSGALHLHRMGGDSNVVWFVGGKAKSCSCKDHRFSSAVCKHRVAADAIVKASF